MGQFLQKARHNVVAMDLPVGDKSASFDTYTILSLGHCLGGHAIPLMTATQTGYDTMETWLRGLDLFHAAYAKYNPGQFYDIDYLDS